MAAVVLAGACAFLGLFAPQPMLPLLGRLFHASAADISLLITASTVGVALAAPFMGSLADRLGRKRVIVPSALLLAIPTLLAAGAGSLNQLLFWRFWQGLLTPGIFAVTVAYINEEWEGGAGAAMSAYVTGTVLGGFIGRMLAAIVGAHVSWRWAFLLLGILNLAGGAAIWAWLPPDRKFGRVRSGVGQARMVWRHLHNSRLLATYACGFCVLFSLISTFTYVNFYLAAPPFRLGTAALGFVFVVYLVGAVITPIAGRFIDRLGHRFAMVASLVLSMAGILVTLVPTLPAVVLGLTLCCTGVFVAQSAASSYIGTVTDEGRAAAVGLYVTAYYAGGSTGAAVTGRFWEWGGWSACVGAIVTVQALVIAIAARYWRPAPEMKLRTVIED